MKYFILIVMSLSCIVIGADKKNVPKQAAKVKVVPQPKKTVPTKRVEKLKPVVVKPLVLSKVQELPADLNLSELKEVFEELKLALQLLDFSTDVEVKSKPSVDLLNCTTLGRLNRSKQLEVVRFGMLDLENSKGRLWLEAFVMADDHKEPTPILADVVEHYNHTVKKILQNREKFTIRELKSEVLKLSYTDTASALSALQKQGLKTIKNLDKIPEKLTYAMLPLVVELPAPAKEQTSLVGGGSVSRNSLGLSMLPNAASQLSKETVANPVSRLQIMYHPDHPEQLQQIKRLLNQVIDKPARQVLIEGLVLEIAETDLNAMGVSWSAGDPGSISDKLNELSGGLLPNIDSPSLKVSIGNIGSADWNVELQALISNGKAEILSRPSVLTLDNRQATIRIGNDLPIAKTTINNDNLSTSFYYIPTGILLNVRPRVSEDAKNVSLAVDTTVSSQVAGEDLEIKDKNDNVVSKAPKISTRRVQTYAMIEDRNPFIIGGLVSRDKVKLEDKIPFLGDIPYIGAFFRTHSDSEVKREVIIVLTPYVLPETNPSWPIPKADEMFDSFDNDLFRSNYRIRPTDVFNLDFLYSNTQIKQAWKVVDALESIESPLVEESPFNRFVGQKIPSSDILVERMVYDIIKSKKVDHPILEDKIIFLNKTEKGVDVDFLMKHYKELEQKTDQALVISFKVNPNSDKMEDVFAQPAPAVYFAKCTGRDEWGKLLWDLNQPLEGGVEQHTIVIHSEKDLDRLRRAVMLKSIIARNHGSGILELANFKVGKQLLMPEVIEDQHHMIDKHIARHFFNTEHYYAAVSQEIDEAITLLKTEIKERKLMPIVNKINKKK